MQLNLVALCFMAILVNVAVSTEERGRRPPSHVEHNTPPPHHGGGGCNDNNNDHNKGCPRKYPLTVHQNRSAQISYEFKQSKIVPDLIEEPPADLLELNYRDLHRCQPNLGNDVDICGVFNAPEHIRWQCKDDSLYTLFLVDINPVGTDRPELLSQGILWWVVDIPCSKVRDGRTLFQYQQPLPLYGAGPSRYAVLAYKQPKYKIDWSEEPFITSSSEKHRYYRCLDRLVNKYQLSLAAGNFYVSEFKPCVEIGLNRLDSPSPQYVDIGVEVGKLPQDPYEADITHERSASVLNETLSIE